jgi:hypothetical protein
MLREYADINELMSTYHYDSRLKERFKQDITYPIVMSTPDQGKLRHEIVGSYPLNEQERLIILDNINTVESVDMPDDSEYGIKIYEYESLEIDEKLRIMKSIYKGNSTLYLQDPETKSTGDVLFMIVQDQKMKTILYARSYNLEDKYNHFTHIYNMDEIWKLKDN